MSTNLSAPNTNSRVKVIPYQKLEKALQHGFGMDKESREIVERIIVEFATLCTDLDRLKRKIDEYETRPQCSGSPYWPNDNPGYMKCNHGVGRSCPMHGSPKNDRSRLRIGIGRDPLEIEKVEQAMLDYGECQRLKAKEKETRLRLNSFQQRLSNSL